MSHPTPRDPLVGALLGGRYRLMDVIGHGGTGRVYRAMQEPIGREVAVKVLHPDLDPDGKHDFQARFLREAAMAGRIQHPHVVTVHDYGRTDRGDCYIVMEHLRGRTLRSVLRDGHLPLPRSLRIFAQLVRGLRATHRAGLVHRDVKPSNIILVDDGEGRDFVKLFDFGLVKGEEESEITHQGTFMGTPQYVSPEQARGTSADARSDLYSAGVILYRMLTGVLPYTGDSPISIAVKHTRDPYPPMAERAPDIDVPPQVEAIVQRLMEKEADRRYRDADSLLDALRWVWDELKLDAEDVEETITVVRTAEDAPSLGSIAGVAAVDDALVALEEDGSVYLRDAAVKEEEQRTGKRARAGLLAAVVLGAAAAGGLVLTQGEQVEEVAAVSSAAPAAPEPTPPPAPQPREVVVLISSDPGQAQVWLEDVLIGETPLARRMTVAADEEPADGSSLVRSFDLRLDGYRDGSLDLDMSGSEASAHVALEPLPRSRPVAAAPPPQPAPGPASGPVATALVADGVRFTADEAQRGLDFVNRSDGDVLRSAGIAPRQANILVDKRPFPDLGAVAATPFIGEKTLEAIQRASAAD